LEGSFTFSRKLCIHLLDHVLQMARIHVAAQLRLYDTGMYGRSAYAALAMPLVESNSKEDVRRLRSAIGNKWLIGCVLKVGIFQVHVGEAVTGRGQIN